MAALGSPILIDGSHGEGSGALFRTSLVMASLTQQAVRIEDVRCGSKYPGLDGEDLVLMVALAKSCAAETTGSEIGANNVSFLPTRKPRGLNQSLDLSGGGGDRRGHLDGRAPSVPVVLNSLLPVLARTGTYSQVSMSGETYGNRTLSFDYFQNVTIGALQKLGLYAFPDQEVAGFGRDSKGQVAIGVEPSALDGLEWSARGKLVGCRAIVTSSELSTNITHRAVSHLGKLAENARIPMIIESNPVDSRTPGIFVTAWAAFERGMGGAGAIGRRGLRVEALAQSIFDDLLAWMSGESTVDPYLADQILIPACFAEGESVFKVSRLTKSLLTSIWVIKQFLPIHITVRGSLDDPGVVTIRR